MATAEELTAKVTVWELERSRDAGEGKLLAPVRARRGGGGVPAVGQAGPAALRGVVHVSEGAGVGGDELAGGVQPQAWGGNRTEAEAQAVLMSVWQTASHQGLAALDFVSQALRASGNRLLPQPCLLAPH